MKDIDFENLSLQSNGLHLHTRESFFHISVHFERVRTSIQNDGIFGSYHTEGLTDLANTHLHLMAACSVGVAKITIFCLVEYIDFLSENTYLQ